MATTYVEGRRTDDRGPRVQFNSEPYRVKADLAGYDDVPAWGVDVKVRSRLLSGSYGGYVPYTVIFVDGEPVALCEDADELVRV